MKTQREIILLGTGTSQGIPVIGCHCKVCTDTDPRNKRLRTAAFIKAGELGIAIDTGPDFRRQMLDNNIDDVHAVLLTHEHNDHISGLDDIRPINFLHQRNIPIYGHPRTMSEMRKRFYYAFDENNPYPGKPRVHGVEIEPIPFFIGDTLITPIPVDHGDMEIYGYRIGDMAYITDVKRIPDSSVEWLRGLEVLVLDALRFEPHATHFNVEEAIHLFEQVRPAACYLTHISHEMGLYGEVGQRLPLHMHLGYDGLRIPFA